MIKNLSNDKLLSHAKGLAIQERQATLALIEAIAEIDQRKLYLERGFASLWELATKELGLSEGAAHRRINAARLLVRSPEIKPAIESGALSLSNAAQVQGFLRREAKQGRVRDPLEVAKAVQNLSQAECHARFFEISPESAAPLGEGTRVVSEKKDRELKFVVSAELFEKLERIKGLIAHAKPNASYSELLDYLATEMLARLEKAKGISADRKVALTAAAKVTALPKGKRVCLPVALRKGVWARSQGQCEFVHQGRRCSSRRFLQEDHVIPLVQGGANELSNLRLLCAAHNRWQAEERGLNLSKYYVVAKSGAAED